MKKRLSLFLAAMLLLMAFVPAASAAQNTNAPSVGAAVPIAGDVDADEIVTTRDVLEIQKYLAGILVFTEQQLTAADVTYDGKVGVSDALKIQQFLAMLVDSLEQERMVTRGEWADLLVSSCSLPPSETRENKYSDISDSNYCESVCSLAARGALPADLATIFSPEAAVEREFAAYTIAHALGYQPEGYTLSCNDAKNVRHQQEAYVVLNLGFLSLERGSFLPQKTLTFSQAKEIVQKLEAYKAGEEADPDHKNIIEYVPGVKVIESGVIAEENGNTVTLSGSGIPVLKAGNIFVTKEAAYKVANVALSGAKTVVQVEQPQLYEVLKSADVQGSGYGDLSKAKILNENVKIIQTQRNTLCARSGEVVAGTDVATEYHFSLSYGAVKGEVIIPNPRLDFSFEGSVSKDKFEIKDLYLALTKECRIEIGADSEAEFEVPLVQIPIALGIGFWANVVLGVKTTIGGKAVLSVLATTTDGIRIVNNMPSFIARGSIDASFDLEASAKAGPEEKITLNWLLFELGDITIFGGKGVTFKPLGKQSEYANLCADVDSFNFIETSVSIGGRRPGTWKLECGFEAQINHMPSHWEDFALLPQCTKDDPARPARPKLEIPNFGAAVVPDKNDFSFRHGYASTEGGKTVGGMVISRYKGTASNIVIPSELYGEPVISVEIGFENSYVQGLTLPETIVKIDVNRFTNLQYVNILPGMEEIHSGAFGGCKNLKAISLPNTLKRIYSSAFSGSGITNFVMPDSVTMIGAFILSGCPNLKSVYLSQGLTCIENRAFSSSGLQAISIPENVQSINYGAFQGCKNLKTVMLPKNLEQIQDDAFQGSGLEKITIPGKTKLKTRVFADCTELKKSVFCSGITEIPISSFEGCTKLESVYLPSSVTRIGDSVFRGCKSLTDIELPYRIEKLGAYCFRDAGLRTITIPGTIVQGTSFAECKNLQRVILLEGFTSIPSYMFEDCSSLTTVAVPKSVEKIENSAFSNCTAMERIILRGKGTVIADDAFPSELGSSFIVGAPKASTGEVFARQKGYQFKEII